MTIRVRFEGWFAHRERSQRHAVCRQERPASAAALPSRSERRLSIGDTGRRRSMGRVLRSGLVLLAWTLVAGCGRYPPVGHAAYELAESVAGVCNGRQEAQLPAARRLIADRHAAGLITRQEETYLLDIIERAERGDWERAERRARRLLLDQSDW